MQLTRSVLDMDWKEVTSKITRFIKDYISKTRVKGIVLGMSGGVDSSTTAALSASAIGGDKVLGLILPEKETYNKKDVEHAQVVAEKFGIKKQTVDITPTLESFYNFIPAFDPTDNICKGNIKARTRMIYIYYYANKFNMIVCGSSDKSETMMGYFTKWGDVAADIYPIMDLYKTQVQKLAGHIGIPDEIVEKPPSPNLWQGQSAEKELGIKYETLDLILYGLEHFMNPQEIADSLKVSEGLVNKIKQRWLLTEHKRRALLAPKLEYRTVGADFRLPRDLLLR